MTTEERCGQDHGDLLRDLRTLPSVDLGRLAKPLLDAAQAGDAGASTHEALRLIGEVLSERKQREAA
jgi:hypothetical protein